MTNRGQYIPFQRYKAGLKHSGTTSGNWGFIKTPSCLVNGLSSFFSYGSDAVEHTLFPTAYYWHAHHSTHFHYMIRTTVSYSCCGLTSLILALQVWQFYDIQIGIFKCSAGLRAELCCMSTKSFPGSLMRCCSSTGSLLPDLGRA